MPIPAFIVAAAQNPVVQQTALTLASHYLLSRFSDPEVRFPPRQVPRRGQLAGRSIIYGRVRIPGVPVFAGVSNEDFNQGGTTISGRESRARLWLVLALAGHPCQSFHEIEIGQEVATGFDVFWGGDGRGQLPTWGSTTQNQGLQAATSPFVSGGNYYVCQYAHLGADDQSSDAELQRVFPSNVWGANHRGRSTAYAVLSLRSGTGDTHRRLFGTLALNNIRIGVQGKNDIYDPRRDVAAGNTAGENAARSIATFRGFSNNPALCWADYLTDTRVGMGLDPSRIDWPSVIAGANVCDQDVVARNISGGNVTQKRFLCYGVLSTETTHRQNLQAILSSMGGSQVVSGGKLTLISPSWVAPTVVFTQDDLIREVNLHATRVTEKRINRVFGDYLNTVPEYVSVESQAFKPKPYQEASTSDSVEPTPRRLRIDLPMVPNAEQAYRLARLFLREKQFPATASIYTNWKGLQVNVGDRIMLTHPHFGWDRKPWQVVSWDLDGDTQGVKMGLMQDDPSIYSNPPASEYEIGIVPPAIPTFAPEVPPPTNLTVTISGIRVSISWTSPDDAGAYDVIQVWRAAGTETDPENATLVWSGRTDRYQDEIDIAVLSPGIAFNYWIRSCKGSRYSDFVGPVQAQYGSTPGVIIGHSTYAIYGRFPDPPGTPDSAGSVTNGVYAPPAGWSLTEPAGDDPIYIALVQVAP